MKPIYLLLTKTNTVPSRLIYCLNGGPYTHCSVSLLPSTEHFYSYARRLAFNPFIAGFTEENLHLGIFQKHADCHCAIYRITVNNDAYLRMKHCIEEHYHHYRKASYNFLGLAALKLGIPWDRNWKKTCSQFVASVLSCTKEVTLPKKPSLMCPNDFLQIEGITLIYQGSIGSCPRDIFTNFPAFLEYTTKK